MKTAATVEKLKKQFSHRSLQNPAGFRTVFTGSTGINLKQQNRTDHLLQIPDIFICYRQALTFSNSHRNLGAKSVARIPRQTARDSPGV
jgi:hypothetical protein